MGKAILVVVLIILALLGAYLYIAKGPAASCSTYAEADCKTKFFCKSIREYGVSCGEGGCQTGERFKNCSPRF